jgi:hypothetical protein
MILERVKIVQTDHTQCKVIHSCNKLCEYRRILIDNHHYIWFCSLVDLHVFFPTPVCLMQNVYYLCEILRTDCMILVKKTSTFFLWRPK